MSLEEKITEILYTIHPKHRSGDCIRVSNATKSILQAVSESLPRVQTHYDNNGDLVSETVMNNTNYYADGYNQAIQEVRKNFEEGL